MIYNLTQFKAPSEKETLEKMSYIDKNDFTWDFVRIKTGFYVIYKGDKYFLSDYSYVNELGREIISPNVGILYVASTEFENYYLLRDIILNNYTDDICDKIELLIQKTKTNDRERIFSDGTEWL